MCTRDEEGGSVPDGIEDNGPSGLVVRFQRLGVVVQAVWRHGAHVEDQRAAEPGQVGGFLGVVGHDGAGADAEGDVGRKVLHHLHVRTWHWLGPFLLKGRGGGIYQIRHVVRQGGFPAHGGDDVGDLGRDDLAQEVSGRGGRIGGGDDGTHDGEAIEGLVRRGGGGEDGGRVGGVDAADAHGGDGRVACCVEGGQDVRDA